MLKKTKISLLILFLCLSQEWYGRGERLYAAVPPEIHAHNAILVEKETGKVLYEKDADARVYPASMTKIMTAYIMLDYIELDEIIVTGSEVDEVPWDSSKAGHLRGESISGMNLLRALMLPSGNETGCVVASAVAKRITGNMQLGYKDAEKIFCDLMNTKAREFGAVNTNFANPHGYHDDDHYTTARDMALICKEVMKNDVIAEVAKETSFSGNGAGTGNTEGMKTQDYVWRTTNKLLTNNEYSYAYATGIKTGFTDAAGHCLASSAEKDGKSLIGIVFNGEEANRWEDSVTLMEWGFETFDYVYLLNVEEIVGEIQLDNPALGEPDFMDVVINGSYMDFMSQDEVDSVVKDIIFDESKFFISEEEETEGLTLFSLPIETGEVLGKVTYTLYGEQLFETPILASVSVQERTFQSDVDYYVNLVKDNAFTLIAIPFWLGFILIILVIILIVRLIIKFRRKRNRYSSGYTFKGKRW